MVHDFLESIPSNANARIPLDGKFILLQYSSEKIILFSANCKTTT